MIFNEHHILLVFTALVFTIPVMAQENDSISKVKENVRSIEAKDIPLDTTIVEIKSLDVIERMEASKNLNDNPLVLIKEGDAGAYNLLDNPQAARYDSIWMKNCMQALPYMMRCMKRFRL